MAPGEQIAVILNNLGGTSKLEELILAREIVLQVLYFRRLTIFLEKRHSQQKELGTKNVNSKTGINFFICSHSFLVFG